MIRKIIRIDKEKCNGCGVCADACHEGAIDIINGKAELVREHFCDGLGDCLPECPTGAISFEEREAPAYDEEAVKEAQNKKVAQNQAMSTHTGCPGSKIMQIRRTETPESVKSSSTVDSVSKLQNWPVQIKLAPVSAPYFDGAKLLIAADCTAYAYASFHKDFIQNKVTLIGCPKLDQVDYSEKLTAIIQNNNIQSGAVFASALNRLSSGRAVSIACMTAFCTSEKMMRGRLIVLHPEKMQKSCFNRWYS